MKNILLVIGFVTLNSCSDNIVNDNRIHFLKSFVIEINATTSDDNQEIIASYFTSKNDTITRQIRNKSIDILRNNNLDRVEIFTYSEAVIKFSNVRLIVDTSLQNNIFVVKETKYSTMMYVKMNNYKIESITPMTKGNVIIGWI